MLRKTASPENTQQLRGGYIDNAPAQNEALPSGPYEPGEKDRVGNLLLFVPRNAFSATINLLTGRYGYSHLAVDCGEVDIPSGKKVMTEVTMGGVHRAFQDEYGDRNFVRIPLRNTGVDLNEFCGCIQEKLGEKYDYGEALTLGRFHNPAKQICSDLATVCLPQDMRVDIARHHQAGFIHPFSAVREYGKLDKEFHLFVSPNGFAEYFGAPNGKKLRGPDQLSEPAIADHPRHPGLYAYYGMLGMIVVSSLALAWRFFQRLRRAS